MVIRFHRNMAVLAAVLLLSHPLLMAASEGNWKLLVGLDLPWSIWLGKIALVILMANILFSIYQKKVNLKFEQWRIGHNISGLLIIVLVFVYSWFSGDDLELTAMKTMWGVLLAAAVIPAVLPPIITSLSPAIFFPSVFPHPGLSGCHVLFRKWGNAS